MLFKIIANRNQLGEICISFVVAAPMAAAISTGVYSAMSWEPNESRVLQGLDLAGERIGFDKYNRRDISSAIVEGGKLLAAGAALRFGPNSVHAVSKDIKRSTRQLVARFDEYIAQRNKTTARGSADSYQAQRLRKDYINLDKKFAIQYKSEITNKPQILSQFNQRTQKMVQSDEYWSLSGRGGRFETWLQSELGASGNFKSGGKEFDGKVGNIWIEAKSGNYWAQRPLGSKLLHKFKSDIVDAKGIAESNGGILQIHSDVRLPAHISEYLIRKGIEFKIHTIFLEVEPCPRILL